MLSIKRQESSGGVIWRHREGQLEVALILRSTKKGKKVWCLPKGMMQGAESLEEAARREVREETGLNGQVSGKLGEIQYMFYSSEDRSKVHKTVHFFLMHYIGGSVADHDFEVEEAKWFPISQALDLLAYETERAIVEKARGMIGSIAPMQS